MRGVGREERLAPVGGEAVAVAVAAAAGAERAGAGRAGCRGVGERAPTTAAAAVGGADAGIGLAPVRRDTVAIVEAHVAHAHATHARDAGGGRMGAGRAHRAAGAAVRDVGRRVDAALRAGHRARPADAAAAPRHAHFAGPAHRAASPAVVVVGLRVDARAGHHGRTPHLAGGAGGGAGVDRNVGGRRLIGRRVTGVGVRVDATRVAHVGDGSVGIHVRDVGHASVRPIGLYIGWHIHRRRCVGGVDGDRDVGHVGRPVTRIRATVGGRLGIGSVGRDGVARVGARGRVAGLVAHDVDRDVIGLHVGRRGVARSVRRRAVHCLSLPVGFGSGFGGARHLAAAPKRDREEPYIRLQSHRQPPSGEEPLERDSET